MYCKYSFEDHIAYVDEFNVKRIYHLDQEENVISITFNTQLHESDMTLQKQLIYNLVSRSLPTDEWPLVIIAAII